MFISDFSSPIFVIGPSGSLFIHGGSFTLQSLSDDHFTSLIHDIEDLSLSSIVIIDGPYHGSFDQLTYLSPDGRCESIQMNSKRLDQSMVALFILEKDQCKTSMPWWGILLLCIASIFIIIIVFVVLVYKVETIRRCILPFR